ncbi:hypothetical protein [Candidatus Cyanaurora vandensis]|uniref:hypothetical protein n=1 Tax=Candidatus Cyanaurora vandensis TaxID=2714958 RepID=UPI002579CA4A|nr:hypothetical protein [Candidatus Cyanaurora vandensis]
MPSRKPWFDETAGQLQLVAYFQRMSSWQQAIADGQITSEEIREQANRVIYLLKSVQDLLSEDQRAQLTLILYEMAVLQAMQTTALTSTLRREL